MRGGLPTSDSEEPEKEDGTEEERNIWFLKSYAVFNAGQIDGLPAHYYRLCPGWWCKRPRVKPLA